jgi:cytochrome c biogenesis protein ResB
MIDVEEWNKHFSKMQASRMRILKRVWRFLVRLDVVAILIFLALILAAIGSCIPQYSRAVGEDPSRLELWLDEAQERYGLLTSTLSTIGAFKIFRTPYFIATLALLLTSTLLCTLDRWGVLWRRAFHPKIQCPDITFSVATHSIHFDTIHANNMEDILYDRLTTRDYKVQTARTEDATYLRGDRNRFSSLGTLVSHLGVVILVLGVLMSSLLGWREELIVHPFHPTRSTKLATLAFMHDGFTIERYADGSASDYVAQILLLPSDGSERQHSLRVNQPVHEQGLTILLRGYQQVGEDYLLSLLIVHDPGYGLLLVAGFLILLGMTISFNFPHRCIHIKLEKAGPLYLAGQADRRDYNLDVEFSALVEELRHSIPTVPD